MATLTVQNITKAGDEPTYVSAAGGGDEFANNGKTMFVLNNGSGGTIVATIITQATKDGLAVADRTVSVLAGDTAWVVDLDPNVYNVPATGRVQVTYDGVTSLTVGAFTFNGM
jgi:hypothetical protein